MVYIFNSCPHWILKDMTLEEAFASVKPDVSHLCVVGCSVYVHVPKEKKTKLEPLSIKGTFVGYTETSKSCKIYIPTQSKIMVSRDMRFDADVKSLSFQDFPQVIDENEKVCPRPLPQCARD
jgi:hypothetical protein